AEGTPAGPGRRTGEAGGRAEGERGSRGRSKDRGSGDGRNHAPDESEATRQTSRPGRGAASAGAEQGAEKRG
ncbi:hypothetical protein C3R44_21550, partial [Mycobacterium tuberculosis]